MLRNLSRHMRQNAVAWLALFLALGGTGAYAANTIGSSDIIDGEVRSADIRNDDIQSGDVKDNSINTFDVHSFLGVDVADGTLTGADIQDNSLTGTDIDEASLNLPATETRFTGSPSGGVALGPPLDDITSTSLTTAGNYAAVATVNTVPTSGTGDVTTTVFCGLYKDGGFIGGAESKGLNRKSLSMNGGFAAGGFTTLEVQCNSPSGGVEIARAQMMVTRIKGFF